MSIQLYIQHPGYRYYTNPGSNERRENASRLLEALLEAGFGTAALTTPEDLLGHEITVFADRVRIDVQTSTPGLAFADAWARRETMTYGGQPFFVVSKEDLIASKRAAGRPKDLDDVRLLCGPTGPGTPRKSG